ncbi:MAG: DUF4058 family protein [Planctomycetes bacterium]|nr:DUF4058 family protein [Planctomycetota bacterium]
MPLLDHFRKPASRVPWRSIHSGWISELATRLNATLPPGYIALDTMSLGGGLEIDIGIEEEDEPPPPATGTSGGTAVAAARAVYVPPAATGTAQYEFPDTMEIRVTNEETGRLVGAVEFVSPGNKDRGAKRDMFLAKCLDNIAGGACVVVVDVITERRANLHNELVTTLGADNLVLPEEVALYAATYRPIIRKRKMNVDVWVNPLQIGAALPTMPLRVVAGLFVPVELEETYAAACRGRKLQV